MQERFSQSTPRHSKFKLHRTLQQTRGTFSGDRWLQKTWKLFKVRLSIRAADQNLVDFWKTQAGVEGFTRRKFDVDYLSLFSKLALMAGKGRILVRRYSKSLEHSSRYKITWCECTPVYQEAFHGPAENGLTVRRNINSFTSGETQHDTRNVSIEKPLVSVRRSSLKIFVSPFIQGLPKFWFLPYSITANWNFCNYGAALTLLKFTKR